MVESVRKFLNIGLEEQKKWEDCDTALKKWRNALAKHDIFVFKEAFRDSGVSGFCLYDKLFPVIFINNSIPKTRQIFTLFHELANLLHSCSIFLYFEFKKSVPTFLRKSK